jgi:hypothetical protein
VHMKCITAFEMRVSQIATVQWYRSPSGQALRDDQIDIVKQSQVAIALQFAPVTAPTRTGRSPRRTRLPSYCMVSELGDQGCKSLGCAHDVSHVRPWVL